VVVLRIANGACNEEIKVGQEGVKVKGQAGEEVNVDKNGVKVKGQAGEEVNVDKNGVKVKGQVRLPSVLDPDQRDRGQVPAPSACAWGHPGPSRSVVDPARLT
jgi:uncharacterized membrane protein